MGVAGALAVGLVAFLLTRGGGIGGIVGIGGSPPSPTVSISPLGWKVSRALPVPTNPNAKVQASQATADEAGGEVVSLLEKLYTAGFLDAGAVASGDYSRTLDFFSGGAKTEAQDHVDVLTAGPDAGSTFRSINPTDGTVRLKVLLGPDGKAVSVVGVVDFSADAAGETGSVQFVSNGQYFLERVGGAWRIVSFDVRRHDVATSSATPTTSATSSAGGTATP